MATRLCSIDGCDRKHIARGYCHKHYKRFVTRSPSMEHTTCIMCGVEMTREKRHDGALPTCSYRCRADVHYGLRTELPDDHPARWFGKSMTVGYQNCKSCHILFAYDGRWPRTYCPRHSSNGSKAARFVSAQCAECGEWFVGDRQQFYGGGGWGTPHCSHECQERRGRRIGKDRRRARKRDAYVADVVRSKVYDADGWRCHICGKKVNRTAKVPHPQAPTIDHVIPLAAGGTHEPANCRTAHFICNARKSDAGGGEQMLLLAV